MKDTIEKIKAALAAVQAENQTLAEASPHLLNAAGGLNHALRALGGYDANAVKKKPVETKPGTPAAK